MPLVRMMGRTAVIAGTAGAVQHRQQNRWAAQEQQQAPAAAPEPVYAAPPAAAEDPTVSKLKELADLHASGVLTDEEFAAAKAKALGV